MSVWEGLQETPAISSIASLIERGIVPPAWLLAGPPGSGKGAVATAMAAALECTEEPGRGCGRCRACVRVARGSFPDVHRIEAEGAFIRVETVREEVIPEASRSPYEGPWKVFIVSEAERMNPSAQNALLKTLEEPLDNTVFVLLTDQIEELLETIRSRCRVVHLTPLTPDQIVHTLVHRGAEQDSASLAVAVTGGDLERAYRLATDPDSSARRAVWLDLCRRPISAADGLAAASTVLAEASKAVKSREKEQRKELKDLLEITGEGRGTAAARTALANRHKRQLKRRETEVLLEALETMAAFYRDVVVMRSGRRSALMNPDRIADLQRWAESGIGADSLLEQSERCLEACAALKKNANPLLTLESILCSNVLAGVS